MIKVNKSSTVIGRGVMSEPTHSGSADEHTEQTEMVGRREAVMRFAKYTAPIMVAALISTSGSKKAAACVPVSNCV
jgi:hypothetical protein